MQPEVSNKIKAQLAELKIPLNSTLTKTIKSAPEEFVESAIEALKEAMANGDVEKPGGRLNKSVKEGWTKNEPQPQQTLTCKPLVYTAPAESSKELIDLKQMKELWKGLK